MPELRAQSATPILDCEAPLPVERGDGLTRSQIFAIIATALTLLSLIAVTKTYVLLCFVILIFALLAMVVIHEAGHLVAGLMVGFQFQALATGPLWIERKSLYWTVRSRRALFAGRTVMLPDRIRGIRRRFLVFIAGGPVADGIAAVVSFAVMPTLDQGWATLLGFWGSLFLLEFILNLMPARLLPALESVPDGVQLRTLFTSREGTRQTIAAFAIEKLRRNNVDRLRWNQRWVKVAYGEVPAASDGYSAKWKAYAEATSPEAAAELLEACLAGSAFLDSGTRDELILEAAYFNAWTRDDSEKATIWSARVVHASCVSPFFKLKADVALSCARRQHENALSYWEQGLAYIQQLPGDWARASERSWIEWKADIEKRLTEPQV